MILIFHAFYELMAADFRLARGNFRDLYENVRKCPVAKDAALPNTAQSTCEAIDLACIWYWKEVLCLQRSAATARLLRRNGIAAALVLGVQRLPFKAHAWVEVDGKVVNDKPYMHELYAVIDRC